MDSEFARECAAPPFTIAPLMVTDFARALFVLIGVSAPRPSCVGSIPIISSRQ
jgi:hypothetical protein